MSTNSKRNDFDNLDIDGDFSVGPEMFDNFTDESPEERGRRRLDRAYAIDLTQIMATDQVRKDFDEEAHRDLVASLEKHGQQQPCRVRWSPGDERYIILQGERRYRAAIDANGVDSLDCVVEDKDLSPGQLIELQLVENTHRQNLNAVEEGEAYQELMQLRDCTAKDLAHDIGVSPNTVQRAVRLLKLPDDILDKVRSGDLPKTLIRSIQAVKAGSLDKTETRQRELIAEYEETGKLNAITEKTVSKPGKKAAGGVTKSIPVDDNITIKVVAKRKSTTLAEMEAALKKAAKECGGRSRSRAA